MIVQVQMLDDVLNAYRAELGRDYDAYRNHCLRVLNFMVLFADLSSEEFDRAALAIAFHDLGIWTHQTFDYLLPSIALARAYLDQINRRSWLPEVEAMNLNHHKLSAHDDNVRGLAEPMRRADWVDVSLGFRRFGLARDRVRPVFEAFPDAGFHRKLFWLGVKRLLTHPWKPLPMLKR